MRVGANWHARDDDAGLERPGDDRAAEAALCRPGCVVERAEREAHVELADVAVEVEARLRGTLPRPDAFVRSRNASTAGRRMQDAARVGAASWARASRDS